MLGHLRETWSAARRGLVHIHDLAQTAAAVAVAVDVQVRHLVGIVERLEHLAQRLRHAGLVHGLGTNGCIDPDLDLQTSPADQYLAADVGPEFQLDCLEGNAAYGTLHSHCWESQCNGWKGRCSN